jgi:hypothetical protein
VPSSLLVTSRSAGGEGIEQNGTATESALDMSFVVAIETSSFIVPQRRVWRRMGTEILLPEGYKGQ